MKLLTLFFRKISNSRHSALLCDCYPRHSALHCDGDVQLRCRKQRSCSVRIGAEHQYEELAVSCAYHCGAVIRDGGRSSDTKR